MKQFQLKLQEQFDKMCATGKLFRVNISGASIYRSYLDAFESDPIFRDPQSSEHNCNTCSNFLRRYGNIVAIDSDNKLMTIFGADGIDEEYKIVASTLNTIITNAVVENVFFETYNELTSLPYEKCTQTQSIFKLGVVSNVKQYSKDEAEKYGVVKEGEIKKFNHLSMTLPTAFVDKTGESLAVIMARYRDKFSVFSRGLEEITLDTLILVKDLINQGSLLDGTAHLHSVTNTLKNKEAYNKIPINERVNWCWKTSHGISDIEAKFKNTLMGVLCSELSEGMDLNLACSNWNKRVDPANYHKVKSPITQRQVEEAQKFVTENGYLESFDRRLATIDDINVTEIKHVSTDGKVKAPVTIFDNIKTKSSSQHKRAQFDNIEEVSIDKFMSDILPSCSTVEALLLNNHEGNLVTLTTANVPESKPIFKWGNNYSWTFNGNLAGKSQLREAVIAKGGRVDGVFRFSQSWNNIGRNESLMDLHVFMPGNDHYNENSHDKYGVGRRVGWNHRTDVHSGGTQDVDYTSQAPVGYIPVENITFPTLSKMPEGKYICKIHNWQLRGTTNSGGTAEIEFEGNVFEYEYPYLGHKEWVTVAEVTLKNGRFTIEHKLPEKTSTKELWGLQTQDFHKVNLVCLSPNHWGENVVGNKHYMFMLDGCKITEGVRGFHNENILPELLQHRKVMDVLGSTNVIEPKGKQLSGLGFNATVKDELIVRLSGSHKRVVKIKF